MKHSTKRFLRAVGSIIDLSPSGNYSEYRQVTADNESIGSDWKIAGDYLRGAVIENGQKKTTKKNHCKPATTSC